MEADTLALLKRLLRELACTQEEELDCEQVFRCLDLYAEAIARGEAAEAMLPQVRQHFEHCRDCEQEFEALLRVLQAGTG